jgi:hypothetical protein
MHNDFTEEEMLEAMELHPTTWIEKYQIKNEAGIPIEFKEHKFMKDFYNDMSPLQVFLKPPQIGATVAEIIKSLYCAKKMGWDIIYTLPTQSDVHDMAGGKINRIVAQNPILLEWVKDRDTVEQKGVGDHIIYYRGTYSTKQAMMVSSDLNIHDEVDASDASVIAQYETRLQAKATGRRWYFSHPSLAGFGVDIHWQKSDKKEWYVTCEHCHVEQQLTWPDNIDMVKRMYICSHCKEEMSNEVRRDGRWKATAVGEFSGYHCSQLMCSWITAEKILKDKEEKDEQYFYNYVLGLPYVGSDNKIDASIVLKNVVPQVNNQEGTIVIGVDTGLPIHFTIMNDQGAFYYGKCKPPSASYDPYEELEGFLIRWPNSILVSDQGGDLIGIRRLRDKYPGRVYLCFYRRDRKGLEMIQWGKANDFGTVVVDRNRMMQLCVDQFRDVGRMRLNGTVEDWKPWAEQWGNIYRVVKEGPLGAEYVWERNGPDHYCHSFLYALVGMDKYSGREAKIVATNMFEDIPVARIFNNPL